MWRQFGFISKKMTMKDEEKVRFLDRRNNGNLETVYFDTSNMPSFWVFQGLIDDPGLDEQIFNAQKETSNLK